MIYFKSTFAIFLFLFILPSNAKVNFNSSCLDSVNSPESIKDLQEILKESREKNAGYDFPIQASTGEITTVFQIDDDALNHSTLLITRVEDPKKKNPSKMSKGVSRSMWSLAKISKAIGKIQDKQTKFIEDYSGKAIIINEHDLVSSKYKDLKKYPFCLRSYYGLGEVSGGENYTFHFVKYELIDRRTNEMANIHPTGELIPADYRYGAFLKKFVEDLNQR